MSGQVTVTLDAGDWEVLVNAARTAADSYRERNYRTSDPEVQYNQDRAAERYRALFDRVSAITLGGGDRMSAPVNYTRDGAVGFTTNGWMVSRSDTPAGPVWRVFDEECVLVGTWESRADAEQAAR